MNTDAENTVAKVSDREKTIVKTSVIGIVTNVLLAAFKAMVGILSHSIAVVLDAVNNLSDALSSVITIIGAKLAGRQPDRKHPLGHGRIEYLSSLIVAGIVLYAGITALVESVRKIIRPEAAQYSWLSLVIIAVAIIVKLFLGRYVKAQGKRVSSGALIASGSDASFDALLSASVLACAILSIIWPGVSTEAYVGAVIAVFIIKAGIEMMIDTVDDLLGHRVDKEMTTKVRQILVCEPEVRGAYDLVLYNYGPDKFYGSVHIELPDTMTVNRVDELTRRLEEDVFRQTGVILTGIGVYSYNTSDDSASRMRNTIQEIVLSHDWALQMHGFYLDEIHKTVRFDVVISFEADRREALESLTREIKAIIPGYTLNIVPDVDITD